MSRMCVCIPAAFLLLFFFSCSPVPDVTSDADASLYSGREAAATGHYISFELSQKNDRDAATNGHYAVRVNDSCVVVLLSPYRSEAKRSAEEVRAYAGKRVKVTGKISHLTFMNDPEAEGGAQTVTQPCFLSVDEIRLAE